MNSFLKAVNIKCFLFLLPQIRSIRSKPVAANVMARGGLPAQLLTDLTQGTRSQMLPGNNVFDPRFDARKLEQERLRNLKTNVVPIYDYTVPKINLADYQDYPFITSMSDRTRTGLLTDIDGVSLNRPVYLQGGQPYMYENLPVFSSMS